MFQALIGPVSSLVGTWLQGKVDKSKAESDVKVARAKAEDKKPGDDKKPQCTFVRIGNKKDEFGNEIGDYKKDCSGGVRSKSPLNPNQLARKIKYRF